MKIAEGKHYLSLGCTFVAVGVDTSLLMNALKNLAQKFNTDKLPTASIAPQVY